MKLIKRLAASLTRPQLSDHRSYWVYLRCARCGEPLRARIDLHNDLSVEYGDRNAEDRFFVRKQVIGSGICFQSIEIELTFDLQRSLIDRSITGGEFISQEEYETEVEEPSKGAS